MKLETVGVLNQARGMERKAPFSCNVLGMRTLRATLVLGLLSGSWLSGCGATSTNDDGARASDAPDPPDVDTEDAEPRNPAGTVSIEVPVAAHRSVEQGPDGNFEWGEPEPIDDAEACVIAPTQCGIKKVTHDPHQDTRSVSIMRWWLD